MCEGVPNPPGNKNLKGKKRIHLRSKEDIYATNKNLKGEKRIHLRSEGEIYMISKVAGSSVAQVCVCCAALWPGVSVPRSGVQAGALMAHR